MKQIPVKEFDDEINVIVIRKPKNTLTLSAVFQTLKRLEILRIIESNVPAIGMHSFWGVPSLRILGKFIVLKFISNINLIFSLFARLIEKQYHVGERG